jgi:hypothetical protein
MKRAIGVLLVAMIILGVAFLAWWYWPDVPSVTDLRNESAIERCWHRTVKQFKAEYPTTVLDKDGTPVFSRSAFGPWWEYLSTKVAPPGQRYVIVAPGEEELRKIRLDRLYERSVDDDKKQAAPWEKDYLVKTITRLLEIDQKLCRKLMWTPFVEAEGRSWMRWFNVVGLFFDLVGATVLAWGLLITKKDALKLGVPRYAGDTDEENLKLPAVQDRIKQSLIAKIGLALLVIGFLLQIVGNWPK